MKLASGPYDGRKARRKRCDYCVQRQLKCQGGFPCRLCTATNRTCRGPNGQKTNAPVFVHATQKTFKHGAVSQSKETSIAIGPQLLSCQTDAYLAYFFESFLRLNAFADVAPGFHASLSSSIHHSLELRDAMKAVSALHITQNTRVCYSTASSPDGHLTALQAYSRSVKSVQAKIESGMFIYEPSALWTTLLLSVFELMRDVTGTNWLLHFLHGTSTILRVQGPGVLTLPGMKNKQRQAFLFSTRIFEIARALIFTEPTFLAAPEWTNAIELYWAQHPDAWTPKDALFDILPQFVDLGIRTLRFAAHAEDMPQWELYDLAVPLGEEGLILRSTILQWYSDCTTLESLTIDGNKPISGMRIAHAYFHTISIYLDGIFSYHAPFTSESSPSSPILHRTEIDAHVERILAISDELLHQGCAGILLFFPLRVAGARARDQSTRSEILRLLQTIMQRGFMVAQSFVEDLNDLWV